jgi:hypothetical protein
VIKPAVMFVTIAIVCGTASASAQSLNDVLTFLLTNRTVATDDFVRDQQAAKAASDAISGLLLIDLNTLPLTTSAGGFTYRFDPTLGLRVRSSDSFDPFFTRRALTPGARQVTVGLGYQQSLFQTIDGRALRDGSLISTASRLHGQTDFFDVEALTMRLQVSTATLVANAGVTDRLEAGAALPLVRITVDGQRTDTYRGRESLQATAGATTSGPGDALVHAKYEVIRDATHGVAIGAEARLPTGNPRNLLGTGKLSAGPLLIASFGDERASVHGNVGYATGGLSNSLDYSAAAIVAASNRLTLVGEVIGHRLASLSRLTDAVAPNPTLVNVDTVRLTSTNQAISRVVAVAGLRWNFRSTWLLSANVVRPLTDAGLNAPWSPTVTLDHSFGQ